MIVKKPSGNYTIEEFDECIYYSSGTYSVVLPLAIGKGRELHIINIGTGIISVKPQTGDTVHANTSLELYQYDSLDLIDLEWQKWMAI